MMSGRHGGVAHAMVGMLVGSNQNWKLVHLYSREVNVASSHYMSTFGSCIFPMLVIILVSCNPNCVCPSEEVIKVEMLMVHEGCDPNEWVRGG